MQDDYEAENLEYYYEGSLPVLAGRFRRKLVGYFDGYVAPGTRIGREIRLVKLPQLTWVYGYLIRDAKFGVVIYVPNSALLRDVEGFSPVRSGLEIRRAQPFTSTRPPYNPNAAKAKTSNADADVDVDDVAKPVDVEEIDEISRP